MATATTKPNPALAPLPLSNRIVGVNSAPAGFDAARDLPEGFLEFLAPLHAALTLRQRALVARRDYALAEAHAGKVPNYLLLRKTAKNGDPQLAATLREACGISEEMIRREEFNPA